MAQRYLLLFEVDELLVTVNEHGQLIRTPGSWELLSQLQGRTDAVSTLVTADAPDDARTKVSEVSGVGLERYLDLAVGAYGTEAAARSEMVSLARKRARESYECEFTVGVVTRSVSEVEQVRDAADVVIAVDGDASAQELSAAGAGHVVQGLVDVVRFALRAQVG